MKNFLLLVATGMFLSAHAQIRLEGTISGENGPIPDVLVTIEGTYLSALSDHQGRYRLQLADTAGRYINFQHPSYKGLRIAAGQIVAELRLDLQPRLMDEVIVNATREGADKFATSKVTARDLEQMNMGQDLPWLLNQQTSVVTTSDAGAGVGYTGIRIRGSDGTRVNVTINGIPVNDAESQGTFWVDLPDIASSTDNIQIQRGAGTSTNGAGAFGGSLNLETTKLRTAPYGEYSGAAGSFNTWKNTVSAGTGLLHEKFSADVRLSRITSDGFIDRASSDLRSYYVSAGYYGKKSIVKLVHFSGHEETYQAWNGVPEARLRNDRQGMQDFIDRNYLDAAAAENLLNSNGRTYNEFTYENQVDNYLQNYYQLHLSRELGRTLNFTGALFYTRGKGYYEEFKKSAPFSSYGLPDIFIGGDTISTTDLIRRRWLDNHFYGATYSINYSGISKLDLVLGGGWNRYDGEHYGEIIWSQHASNHSIRHRYYQDTATKTDLNIFLKAGYDLTSRINLFMDLQYRAIDYRFTGFDDSLMVTPQDVALSFFNPKAGVTWKPADQFTVHASYSRASKEPARKDYTESSPTSRPRPEYLDDYEAGIRFEGRSFRAALNGYHMAYKDQLVLTGGVNDVGAYNRINVKSSFRQGIEMEAGWRFRKILEWSVNATVSNNKIKRSEEYVVIFDSVAQQINVYENAPISFSPELIAGSTLAVTPLKGLRMAILTKYVGSQFMDNTGNNARKLDAYLVNDLQLSYSIPLRGVRELTLRFMVNNLLNEEYESNGYTYNYLYGGIQTVENFYYPQAGRNYSGGLTLKF